jgi:hypothetical protein
MGLFNKKADPITERSKALKAEIAALESQIKRLSSQPETIDQEPRFRPAPFTGQVGSTKPAIPAAPPEPVFEEIDPSVLHAASDTEVTAAHYNDLGIRKYDLASALRRFRNHVRGKPVANPKLVTFLAAGSIQGLRPLRYEKRVARNRFIFLASIFLVILGGLLAVFLRQR